MKTETDSSAGLEDVGPIPARGERGSTREEVEMHFKYH